MITIIQQEFAEEIGVISLTKEEKARFRRQLDLINCDKLRKSSVSLIGVGSIGSFTALVLAKMGVGFLTFYDEDGVSEENLPAQFFKNNDLSKFKVEALADILQEFTTAKVKAINQNYVNQKLEEIVIVATDDMPSRKNVWNQFLKQSQCKVFIDARMGAELERLYVIRNKRKDKTFYEETLYEKGIPVPCTAKTIIYNVVGIASDICTAFKMVINNEPHPREVIFDRSRIYQYSHMTRD